MCCCAAVLLRCCAARILTWAALAQCVFGNFGEALQKQNFCQAAIAQLGERQTEDLKVPGSIPGLGMPSLGPEEVKWLDFKGSTLYPRSADASFSF